MSWMNSCRGGLTLLLFLGALAGPTAHGAGASAAEDTAAEDTAASDAAGAVAAGGPEAGEEDERREPLTELVLVEAAPPYVPASNSILSKLPMELMRTPANVGAVGAPLMEEQDDLVLSDALRNVSGINVQPQSGVQDFFFLRGFDSVSGGLILTDGAMEPEATVYQTYNLERVEVFKGPAGFLYGPNPLSGAVNLVRKQPLPSRLYELQFQGGSDGFAETTFDVNLPAGESFQFRLNGLYRQADGARDRELEDWAINPAFTWLWGRSSLTLNLEAASVKRTPDAGLPLLLNPLSGDLLVPQVDRAQVYNSPFDFSEQDVGRLQVDWEMRLSDKVRLRDKVYGRHLDWQTDGTILSGAFPVFDPNSPLFGDALVVRNLTALDDRQNILGNQFEAIFELTAGSWKHDLLVGLEISRHTDEFSLGVAPTCSSPFGFPGFCLQDIALLNPVETATSRPVTSPFEQGDSTTDDVAPYILDQIASDGRWSFLVGARLDYLTFKDDLVGTDRSESNVSPMVGVVFAPTKSGSIYMNAGQAFAPPSPRATGDPKPEESTQVELGYRHLFVQDHLQTTFALYQLQRDNIGIPDDNGFTQQTGDQESRGFEFELAYEGTRHLRAFVAYAYNDSELTSFSERLQSGFDCDGNFTGAPVTCDCSGNDPAFTPHHIANAWVSKKWQAGFGIGGGGRYVSRQYIAEDNSFRLDDYVVADAAIFYERPHYRVFLNMRNLFDEEYNVRAFPSTAVMPAPGRTAFVGIRFRN